jgi:hypothetical protein
MDVAGDGRLFVMAIFALLAGFLLLPRSEVAAARA